MGPSRHFHADHRGHSVTVAVRGGRVALIEVQVDGEEVCTERVRARGTAVLEAELPGEPARPFRVFVHRPRLGSGVLRCALEAGSTEIPMAERAAV
ncbi:hypothetical protein IHE55_27215 [Streptomyces pactum]|uniref:Uncharacterized protein n=1 Tax=Streptomyces pactum TaxID=68249 RepID=A0ABS0NSV3_9ACTN|nr:hypothetical protein [Streptomyces pactum]MBH5338275.1 hypothetical protein [Streptomyces pactum]